MDHNLKNERISELEKALESLRRQTVGPKPLVYSLVEGLVGRRTFSQASQDLFVLDVLNDKRSGTYLEIGGGHYSESNNTFLLEKDFSWGGASIELDGELVREFNQYRVNPCVAADATSFDFKNFLETRSFPAQIDYLSIDIDPAPVTFKALQNLPHHRYRFSVITYEHDRYLSGDQWMMQSRDFLSKLGYKLIVKNVACFGRDIEDWWVDPQIVSEGNSSKFVSSDIEFSTLWLNVLGRNYRASKE